MNILHFIVFFFGSIAIIIFAFNQNLLNKFGMFFGIARGADLLVYSGLMLLAYFYISLLNSHTKDKHELTRLISQLSVDQSYQLEKENMQKYKNTNIKDDFVLNIRVYNEGIVLANVIDEIIQAGFKKLIFINDGSSDNSLNILQTKKNQNPNCIFIILSHLINRGGGAANQTGYKFIQKYADQLQIKRFVGFDADGQMNIKDMEQFIAEIQKDKGQVQAYLGSRFIKGGKAENITFFRKIILAISKIVTAIFYKAKVSDPHNGYRVIHINSFKNIQITADGMHYANELNEQIRKHKIIYKEIPVHIRYTKYSLTKGQKNSNSIKLAIEMIYKKIFFR